MATPPPNPHILLVRHNAFLALVPDQLDALPKLLCDSILVSSLAEKRVNGLQFGPALLLGNLGEIGGSSRASAVDKLYLDPMHTNLGSTRGAKRLFYTQVTGSVVPLGHSQYTLMVATYTMSCSFFLAKHDPSFEIIIMRMLIAGL